MQESVEMPEDPAHTGQEIVFEYEDNLIPVPATIPCTLEEGNDSTAGSEPAGREQGTSGERCGKSNIRRKRPSSSLLRELMAMHQQAEERAAKAAKESSELRKQLIELQKGSNEVQKDGLWPSPVFYMHHIQPVRVTAVAVDSFYALREACDCCKLPEMFGQLGRQRSSEQNVKAQTDGDLLGSVIPVEPLIAVTKLFML
ncbi:uncharacterized protein LOC144121842 [Amblyomma americanum]